MLINIITAIAALVGIAWGIAMWLKINEDL